MDSPPPTTGHHPFGSNAKVAVIGAGISGVCTAAHLLRQGLSVTVFERSGIEGGVWHYDERVSGDPRYPNETPSLGDYEVSLPGQFAYRTPPPEPEEGDKDAEPDEAPSTTTTTAGSTSSPSSSSNQQALEIAFSPPGPCYAGLTNNVPTTLMVSALEPWPPGTEPNVSQAEIEKYVQTVSRKHGVRDATLFHTRVDDLRKRDDGAKWLLRSVTLEKKASSSSSSSVPHLVERNWEFDLVVVATGHYNMPRIPDIPGLKEWKAAFPDRVMHSKQYRNPARFAGKNVLVIGAGVSSLDICRELDGVANRTFQSTRGGTFDLAAHLLPGNSTRVAEIAAFRQNPEPGPADDEHQSIHPPSDQPIPGTITLKDGQTLPPIHHVIIATGYITSYPFLPHLHADSSPRDQANDTVVVTSDGDMTHNLHKDIFYIDDPSLAFVGVPYYTATFSLFDFQAQAVALAFAGKATLPGREAMRTEYRNRLREKGGGGRAFHSLRGDGREITYVKELVDWVNGARTEGGDDGGAAGVLMRAHSEAWVREYWLLREKLKGRLEKEAESS